MHARRGSSWVIGEVSGSFSQHNCTRDIAQDLDERSINFRAVTQGQITDLEIGTALTDCPVRRG